MSTLMQRNLIIEVSDTTMLNSSAKTKDIRVPKKVEKESV